MKQSRSRVVSAPMITPSVPVQEIKTEDILKTKLGVESVGVDIENPSLPVKKSTVPSSSRRKKEVVNVSVPVPPPVQIPSVPIPEVIVQEEEEEILDTEEEEHTFENAELLENNPIKKRNRRVVTKDSFYKDFEGFMTTFESFLETLPQGQVKVNGFVKKLKQLQTDSYRLLKLRREDKKPRGENNSGFMKPIKVSQDLASFMGLNTNEPITRVLVTKKLCQYIKEKDLQNPEDRRQILPDESLKRLFHLTGNQEEEKLTYYSMQKAIQQHIYKI